MTDMLSASPWHPDMVSHLEIGRWPNDACASMHLLPAPPTLQLMLQPTFTSSWGFALNLAVPVTLNLILVPEP
jgi:hypothetical protein